MLGPNVVLTRRGVGDVRQVEDVHERGELTPLAHAKLLGQAQVDREEPIGFELALLGSNQAVVEYLVP